MSQAPTAAPEPPPGATSDAPRAGARPFGRRSRWGGPPRLGPRGALAAFLAGAVLATVLSTWPIPGPFPPPATALLRPATDVLLGAGLVLALGPRLPRGLPTLLAAVLVVGRLLRIGDALMITYFGRTVTLYLDVALVPELGRLLADTLGPALAVWTGFGIAAGVAALVALGGRWLALGRRLGGRERLGILGGLAVLGLVQAGAGTAGGEDAGLLAPSALPRLVEEVDFLLHVHGLREETRAAFAEARERLEAAPKNLDGLADTDVYLLFVESYGTTVWEDPDHLARFRPAQERLATTAREAGYAVRSGALVSPTFGGASWLAHGTVASGVPLTTQLRFDLLVTSDLEPLARHLRRAGHHTVELMPGTKRPFPEGRWFGFEDHLYQWHFGYRGPRYDWAPMPDQLVLDTLLRRFVRDRSDPRPLFAEVVLVSSHAPFRRQPPYVEDWSRLGDGSIFRELDTVRFEVPFPDMTRAGPAYVASIAYVLRCVGGFLERLPRERPAVVFVLGDHQPNPQITGPGAPFTVPMHVLSRQEGLVEAFGRVAGLEPGWDPGDPAAARGMARFPTDMLEAYSR